MTCHGDTHVFLVGATGCTCGAFAQTGGWWYGYHPPGYKPATPDLPDIPAHVKRLAIQAGASHLSADGKTAYRLRFGKVDETYLKSGFDSWWVTNKEGLPEGVIKLDE